MRLTARRKRLGLSLVEVAVAVGVLAIGLAGVLAASAQGLAGAEDAERAAVAALLAERALETLRARTAAGGWDTLGWTPEDYGTIADAPFHRRTVDVVQVQPDLKLLTAHVGYRVAGRTSEQTVTLSTLLLKP